MVWVALIGLFGDVGVGGSGGLLVCGYREVWVRLGCLGVECVRDGGRVGAMCVW